MTVKSIIAFLLGLVIQLSQVPSSLAGETAKSCATSMQRMDCCKGMESCPCAKESDQEQKPTPLAPTSVELKLLISKAPDQPSVDALIFPPTEALSATVSQLENRNGYAGVPLSVAFCRFVI